MSATSYKRRHCGVIHLRRDVSDFPTGAVQFCEGIKIVRLAAGGTAQKRICSNKNCSPTRRSASGYNLGSTTISIIAISPRPYMFLHPVPFSGCGQWFVLRSRPRNVLGYRLHQLMLLCRCLRYLRHRHFAST